VINYTTQHIFFIIGRTLNFDGGFSYGDICIKVMYLVIEKYDTLYIVTYIT